MSKIAFSPADILIPYDCGLTKWAVVACDQFTSQPDYWARVRAFVGDAPSTLHIIQPEIDLAHAEENIPVINANMRKYLDEGVLETKVSQGFVLTERVTDAGMRLGLIAAVDLDAYDFTPGAKALIRATEETIAERVPPRVRIRRDAPIETPHVMMLIDDPEYTVVEAIYERVKDTVPLYDFTLMEEGGTLRGWAVNDETLKNQLSSALTALHRNPEDFLYVVGDGNHSLATAKACWEEIKPKLTEEERAVHPAKYALTEIVNLHSPALQFEPIHRVLFGVDGEQFVSDMIDALTANGFAPKAGSDIVFIAKGKKTGVTLTKAGDLLPVAALQPIIDKYLKVNPGARIDYIHGDDTVCELSARENTAGILLTAIPKRALFPAVRAGGVLPRKTFSMGEAREKRYYMECRKIK